MGWGAWEGCNNNHNNNHFFQSSAAAGSWKLWISYSSLVLLRDVEKETHKHKVLWEKWKFANFGEVLKLEGCNNIQKCLCTSNRVGVSKYTNYCVKFPFWKWLFFYIFCISWGGGHGRGATTTTITTTTSSKVLRPLGIENSEFPILLSSCSGM